MRKKIIFYLALVQFVFISHNNAQIINTVIGGLGDHGVATNAEMYYPYSVATDKWGNVYIADLLNNIIRKIDTSQNISTFAGTPGTPGFYGDGGPAIFAELNHPIGIATDTFGNLYIADAYNQRIRKVDTSGIITTIAGKGTVGYSGDGGAALNAQLSNPYSIAIDNVGNIYFADNGNNRIRKIRKSDSTISSVAGNGVMGFNGDNIAATAAAIAYPTSICIDNSGNLYIADNNNNRVRKINNSGIITSFAGYGLIGYTGDGGPASVAKFNLVTGLASDNSGNIYIADNNNNEIRKVDMSGTITTIAGSYLQAGFSGDMGPATAALLNGPTSITFDKNGNYYIADLVNNRIRKVNTSGIISTIAGNGQNASQGLYGDEGPAISALLHGPLGLAYDTSGNLYIADAGNHCIRKVDTSGRISTVAGNDTLGNTGDGGLAIYAKINNPVSVATDRRGNLFICDYTAGVIRKVSQYGLISTYAGNGGFGFSGDGGNAALAKFASPTSIATDYNGNLYICDKNNNRIRMVDTNQIITTVCGTGIAGYLGDAGAATNAQINLPTNICIDSFGNIIFADFGNFRIRKISTSGVISTIAGTGSNAINGNNGPAIFASIGSVSGITTDKTNNIYICANNLIRRINSFGIISSFAGTGNAGYYGDGGNAASCSFNFNNPTGIIIDTNKNVFISDYSNNRIRKISTSILYINTSTDTICKGSTAIFTASIYNTNTGVVYHWLKNGNKVGTNNIQYTPDSIKNGDIFSCYITKLNSWETLATSNNIKMTVDTLVKPIATIQYGNTTTTFCIGDTVKTSATLTYGGTAPIVRWYVNNNLTDSGINFNFVPNNGDSIYCILTSNTACTLNNIDTSNKAAFKVIALDSPYINFSINPGTIVCPQTTVNCTASLINGGKSPKYYWYYNGSIIADTFNSYAFIPNPGDSVFCKVTCKGVCNINKNDTTKSITGIFTYASTIIPAVSIIDSPGNTNCVNTLVKSKAVGINGGSAPLYKWYKNSLYVASGPIYNFTPLSGDTLYVALTSSLKCASPKSVSSNYTIFSNPTIAPKVSISCNPGTLNVRGTLISFHAVSTDTLGTYNYQWYKNDNPISGAIHDTFSSSNFSYLDSVFCVLSVPGNCNDSSISNKILMDTYHEINVTPNPNNGNFVLSGSDLNASNNNIDIRIYNSLGEVVYKAKSKFNNVSFENNINLSEHVAPGVYLLLVTYNNVRKYTYFSVRY